MLTNTMYAMKVIQMTPANQMRRDSDIFDIVVSGASVGGVGSAMSSP